MAIFDTTLPKVNNVGTFGANDESLGYYVTAQEAVEIIKELSETIIQTATDVVDLDAKWDSVKSEINQLTVDAHNAQGTLTTFNNNVDQKTNQIDVAATKANAAVSATNQASQSAVSAANRANAAAAGLENLSLEYTQASDGSASAYYDPSTYTIHLTIGKGSDGKTIISGDVDPTNSVGTTGDFYYNRATSFFFGPKGSSTWPAGFSIKGIKGDTGATGARGTDGTKTIAGAGTPSNAVGTVGDSYVDIQNFKIFVKGSGGWGNGSSFKAVDGSNGRDGIDGAPGKTIIHGTTVPANTLGTDGDFYLRTDTLDFYGPKATTWPAPINIKGTKGDAGTDGKTIYNGTTVPDPSLGVAGDFYLRTDTQTMYGPKTGTGSNAWGTGVLLKGNDGKDGKDGTLSLPGGGVGIEVGQYGLGGTAETATNLNAIKKSGWYKPAAANSANQPPNALDTVIMHISSADNTRYQMAFYHVAGAAGATPEVATRYTISGDQGWTTWEVFPTTFGTAASRNVGTSTGNVLEVGAFGLGKTSTVANADEITQTGFYLPDAAHAPVGALTPVIYHISRSPTIHYQTAYYKKSLSDSVMYTAHRYTLTGKDNWTSWSELNGSLGTAASKDVGTAAGNVMTVGAFGLGGNEVNYANKDLNGITQTGWYLCEITTANSPDSSKRFSVMHMNISDQEARQVAWGSTGLSNVSGNAAFTRHKFNNTWGDWEHVDGTGAIFSINGAKPDFTGDLYLPTIQMQDTAPRPGTSSPYPDANTLFATGIYYVSATPVNGTANLPDGNSGGGPLFVYEIFNQTGADTYETGSVLQQYVDMYGGEVWTRYGYTKGPGTPMQFDPNSWKRVGDKGLQVITGVSNTDPYALLSTQLTNATTGSYVFTEEREPSGWNIPELPEVPCKNLRLVVYGMPHVVNTDSLANQIIYYTYNGNARMAIRSQVTKGGSFSDWIVLSSGVKTVNGVAPLPNGNVTLNVGVKTVNGAAPDSGGNVTVAAGVSTINNIIPSTSGNIDFSINGKFFTATGTGSGSLTLGAQDLGGASSVTIGNQNGAAGGTIVANPLDGNVLLDPTKFQTQGFKDSKDPLFTNFDYSSSITSGLYTVGAHSTSIGSYPVNGPANNVNNGGYNVVPTPLINWTTPNGRNQTQLSVGLANAKVNTDARGLWVRNTDPTSPAWGVWKPVGVMSVNGVFADGDGNVVVPGSGITQAMLANDATDTGYYATDPSDPHLPDNNPTGWAKGILFHMNITVPGDSTKPAAQIVYSVEDPNVFWKRGHLNMNGGLNWSDWYKFNAEGTEWSQVFIAGQGITSKVNAVGQGLRSDSAGESDANYLSGYSTDANEFKWTLGCLNRNSNHPDEISFDNTKSGGNLTIGGGTSISSPGYAILEAQTGQWGTNSALYLGTCFGNSNRESGATFQFKDSAAYLSIPSGSVDIASGSLTAVNIYGHVVNSSSDIKLKEDLKPIEDALDKIDSLNGMTYHLKSKEDDSRDAGLIAQDLQKVLPEVVSTHKDHLTVNYNGVTALLVNAIKELKGEVDALKAEVENLKSQSK